MGFLQSFRALFKSLLCHFLVCLLLLNGFQSLTYFGKHFCQEKPLIHLLSSAQAEDGPAGDSGNDEEKVPKGFTYDEEIDFTNTGFWSVIGQILVIVEGLWAILSMIPPCLPNPNCTPPIPVISYNLSNTKSVVNTIWTLTDYAYQGERLVKKMNIKYDPQQSDEAQLEFHKKALDELQEQHKFVKRIATRAHVMMVVQGVVVGFATAEVIVKWSMVAIHTSSMNPTQAGLWAEEGMTCEKAGKLVKDALGISAAMAVVTGFAESIWDAIKSVFVTTAGEKAAKSFFEKYGAEIRLAFALLGLGFAIYTHVTSQEREEEVKKRLDSYQKFLDELREKMKATTFFYPLRKGAKNLLDNLIDSAFATLPESEEQTLITPEMNSCYIYTQGKKLQHDKNCLCQKQGRCMQSYLPSPESFLAVKDKSGGEQKLLKNSRPLLSLNSGLKLVAKLSAAIFNGQHTMANQLGQEIIAQESNVDKARRELMLELKQLKRTNAKFKSIMHNAVTKAKNSHLKLMDQATRAWNASGRPLFLSSLGPMPTSDKLPSKEHSLSASMESPLYPSQFGFQVGGQGATLRRASSTSQASSPLANALENQNPKGIPVGHKALSLGQPHLDGNSDLPDEQDGLVVANDEVHLDSRTSLFEIISMKYLQKMPELQK